MKDTFLQRNFTKLAALALCTSLSFTAIARADGSGDQEDNQQGGDISGSETLNESVTLLPPVPTPGVSGAARLSVESEDGVSTAGIKLEETGLAVGTYSVGVTLISDSTSIVLGSFDVLAPVLNPRHRKDDDEAQTEVRFGGDSANPWPAGLNGFDIGTLFVTTGTSNTTVLSGDFASAGGTGDARFHVNVATTPGVAAPNSRGHVMIQAKLHKGVAKGVFMLKAQGLPGNVTMTLAVNGTDVGNVTSDRRGHLSITRTPGHNGNGKGKGKGAANGLPSSVDILSINSVSLHFADGTELLHADL